MANPRLCSIPDCDKPHEARGWCSRHYANWKNHRDPNGGRTKWGEPLKFILDVAANYNGDDCLKWPFATNGGGYGRIRFDNRTRPAIQVVCTVCHGERPTPKHSVAHSCGKGREGCVSPRHLRWATHAENMADEVGRIAGAKHHKAKLTELDVRQIRSYKDVLPATDVGSLYGVARETVNSIWSGKSWSSLD